MRNESATRASEFIGLFNRLERHLRTRYRIGPEAGFADLIEQAAQKNSAVRSYAWWIKDFGRLRNAIVHRWDGREEVIAEPSEKALTEFRTYVEQVLSPTRLGDIASPHVRTFETDCPLAEVLSEMDRNNFSQVVVRKDLRLRLLSVDGTTRWLAAMTQRHDGAPETILAATVGDALRFEPQGSFRRLSGQLPADDAREIFVAPPAAMGTRVYAIIVTQNGRDTDEVVGIVTPWDLLKLPRASEAGGP